MTTPHSTSAQTFALAALLAFTAACGVDSDIGSPCRHASTISMPFPAEAILEDSKECSTGTCLAYEGPSYLLYSNTLEECLAEDDGSRCSPGAHCIRPRSTLSATCTARVGVPTSARATVTDSSAVQL